ncbi:MAG: hypothetical protein WC480_00890 [Patescibacteria group bacterium]
MNDKTRLGLIIILTITVILMVIALGVIFLIKGDYSRVTILGPLAIIIVVTAAVSLYKVYQRVKQGFPLKDERSKGLERQAATWAFYVGIYWLLILSWLSETSYFTAWGLAPRHIGELGIIGMALVFSLAYWHFSRRGGRV